MTARGLTAFSAALALVAATSAHAGQFNIGTDAGNAKGVIAQRFAYRGYGCTGENVTPSVHWHGAPAGAKSFALTVFDPDAKPTGWWHWIVLDLPTDTTALSTNARLPPGAHALNNDFGTPGWGGPCPPEGDSPHHYVFTLYALDVPHLVVSAHARPMEIDKAIHAHALAEASLTLTYGR